MTTAYYTIDSQIVGEVRGSTRVDYLTDALGSVTARINQGSVAIDSARYRPFGDFLSGTEYTFGWVGSLGYRYSVEGHYIRARHYFAVLASWSSTDHLWPMELPFTYSNCSPTVLIDPSGLKCGKDGCCCKAGGIYISKEEQMRGEPQNDLRWGNSYDLTVYASGVSDDKLETTDGQCTLELWECSNFPLVPLKGKNDDTSENGGKPLEAGEWHKRAIEMSPDFKPWFDAIAAFNCLTNPKAEAVVKDAPSLTSSRIKTIYDNYDKGKRVVKRYVYQRYILRPSAGEKCKGDKVYDLTHKLSIISPTLALTSPMIKGPFISDPDFSLTKKCVDSSKDVK